LYGLNGYSFSRSTRMPAPTSELITSDSGCAHTAIFAVACAPFSVYVPDSSTSGTVREKYE
jgi:hypothetical protein